MYRSPMRAVLESGVSYGTFRTQVCHESLPQQDGRIHFYRHNFFNDVYCPWHHDRYAARFSFTYLYSLAERIQLSSCGPRDT